MNSVRFTKMEGLGNDFIVVDGPFLPRLGDVAAMCDRHFGIGADGVLAVTPGEPIKMDYWNADGSRAEMCGNGLRCVASYAHLKEWTEESSFTIDTPAGPRRVEIRDGGIRAEIGTPLLEGKETVEGALYHLVDIGNPHAVTFVDSLEDVEVGRLGRKVAQEAGFDAGCNVEFITGDQGGVRMRVWERGSGETLACGTGMVAAAAVVLAGDDGEISVSVPGGHATVEIVDGIGWLTGSANVVFAGEWLRDNVERR